MAYWWVSQNQTYDEEHGGGYLWAPRRDANGLTPHHWRTMPEVAAGDVIFSYVGQSINAVAVANSAAYAAPRPFQSERGQEWELDGWRIDVAYDFIDPPLPVPPIAERL